MKPHSGNNTLVIGVMSGTSLDGMDLAAVRFSRSDRRWEFTVDAAETVPYSGEWSAKLSHAHALSGVELIELHHAYGRLTGREVNRFVERHRLHPALIASHGHTIFHRPDKGYTFQLGSGAAIAAETETTTIADFRSGDVALGGQGAPLVPIGDQLLFPEYDYCLNLGGFANISYEEQGKRIAFDVCPVNFILNVLARELGYPYDCDGRLSRQGSVDIPLLDKLNQPDFYRQPPPKSLGREWVEECLFPIINSSGISANDKIRTVCEHIAMQVALATPHRGRMLITGGGALNSFLMERFRARLTGEITIPAREIIEFKEAIIFAFLGLLRFKGEVNCLASVTGARKNSSSGIIFPG